MMKCPPMRRTSKLQIALLLGVAGVLTAVAPVAADEICRDPGFWGTHGGTEQGGTNMTLALLDGYNSANGPDLVICGRTINDTTLGSVGSALEAICVRPRGDDRLQLARQLTAAALNCIITRAAGDPAAPPPCDRSAGLAGDVCSGVSIAAIFDACNSACAAGATAQVLVGGTPTSVSCVTALDCFNNGGNFDAATGQCTSSSDSCKDNPLVNGCFDFQPAGPAGSPGECNDSRRNSVVVVPPLP